MSPVWLCYFVAIHCWWCTSPFLFLHISWLHRADIALIGLAVMGQNLILNMNDHGFVVSDFGTVPVYFLLRVLLMCWNRLPFRFQVCAYNRTVSKVQDFLQNEAKGTKVIGAESLQEMVSKLKTPRRIILLVKAGQAVDDFIDNLVMSCWVLTWHCVRVVV